LTVERQNLPVGTRIEFKQGSVYEITGKPIGQGGGSILYPAVRIIHQNGIATSDGFHYVLKECYPSSSSHLFLRNENGEIIAQMADYDGAYYLERARTFQINESVVSQKIYQSATRMIPIRESSPEVLLTLPGKKAAWVKNTMTAMDSLAEKGSSLAEWIKEYRRFSPAETLRIVQQLLFALSEVHQAGFIHLDIQSGNVFVKGSLEKKDALVTLIDFGAARPIQNGKTDKIQDKVVFTTPGFSAPEILLQNDGTLQLGAEADIYSVGCLMLYLLTGKKPDQRILLENQTGVYLKPNQLQRIKCPNHLIGRIQDILGKALNKTPEKRYHSAEEMLHEVTDLLEALQPYRTDLSAVKYDAFICYKHGAIDSMAAKMVQKELENYRAPKGTSLNRKPFSRVFLDEGELSSCADFGLQIKEALQNSGWLIVICSEDTPRSPWVQSEIETFLETHSRSRILCIMTGGDENISFPPQLKGDSAGVGEILAADARGKDIREVNQKLRKDALLKIAAPMLGTTFDSLKQRQKLYQMQRLAACMAVLAVMIACFGAYAVDKARIIANQAIQIEQEYQNSLINESLFLAQQAEQRLADNDPVGAIELALQALPSEAQNRPIVPEAEYVLGKALGIYTTPATQQNIASVTGMHQSEYAEYFVTEDGANLIFWDETKDIIQIVDSSTLNLSKKIQLADTPVILSPDYFVENDKLVVPMDDFITCANYLTGETLWTVNIEDLRATCISDDDTAIVAVSHGESGGCSIRILNANTGECKKQFDCTIPQDQSIQTVCSISPNSQWLTLTTYVSGKNSLYVLNFDNAELTQLIEPEMEIADATFVDNQLSVIRAQGGSVLIKNGKDRALYADPINVHLELYDLQTMALVWKTERQSYWTFDTPGITISKDILYTDNELSTPGMLYLFSNQCWLLNQTNGSEIKAFSLSAPVLNIHYSTNGILAVTCDGSLHNVDFSNGQVLRRNLFGKDITAAYRSGSDFYVQNYLMFEKDYRIYKYELDKFDDSYATLANLSINSSDAWRSWNLLTVCSDTNGAKAIFSMDQEISIVDIRRKAVVQFVISPDYGFADSNLLGFASNGSAMYWCTYDGGRRFFSMEMESGHVQELKLPKLLTNAERIQIEDVVCYNDCLYLIAAEEIDGQNELAVYRWELSDNAATEIWRSSLYQEINDEQNMVRYNSYIPDSVRITESGKQIHITLGRTMYSIDDSNQTNILMQNNPEEMIIIDISSSNTMIIPLNLDLAQDELLYQRGTYIWNQHNSVALVEHGNTLYALNSAGTCLWQKTAEATIFNIIFSADSDEVFVLYDNGTLSSYQVMDGTPLRAVDLSDYSENSKVNFQSATCCEYLDQETLLVYGYEESFLLDIQSFKVKAVVNNCVGFDSADDGFIVTTDRSSETEIGYFQRYSVYDLIEKAQIILQ